MAAVQSGGSYDDLFAKVKQKAAEGTRVSVYLASGNSTSELEAAIVGVGGGEVAAKMRADIAAVDPASVVVNWECCGGCSDDRFHGNDAHGSTNDAPTMLMATLLARGFMVMVSDFSLGALIHNWDSAALGANPFKKVGEFGEQMTLRFDPAVLAACDDSAQLQVLGELCASGEAHVHAMAGTKAYTVDANVTPAAHPRGSAGWEQLQVLTIVTKAGGQDASAFTQAEAELCTVGGGDNDNGNGNDNGNVYSPDGGERRGIAGHVLLRYPSGGRLLASCPHWIELSKLDVSAEQLLVVATQRYGAAYAGAMRTEMNSFGAGKEGDRKRAEYSSARSCDIVQQTAPSSYTPFKKRGGKKG